MGDEAAQAQVTAEHDAIRAEYAELRLTDDQVARLASTRRIMGAGNSLDRIYKRRLLMQRRGGRTA